MPHPPSERTEKPPKTHVFDDSFVEEVGPSLPHGFAPSLSMFQKKNTPFPVTLVETHTKAKGDQLIRGRTSFGSTFPGPTTDFAA